MNTQYITELTTVKIFLSRCSKHHNTIIYGGLEGQLHTFLALVPYVHARATLSFGEVSLAPTGSKAVCNQKKAWTWCLTVKPCLCWESKPTTQFLVSDYNN